MNEYRLTERLVTYWNSVRSESETVPAFSHFNPGAIDDIWQQCILFGVLPYQPGKLPNLHFTRIGDKLHNMYGHELVGQTFNPGQRHLQCLTVMRKMAALTAQPVPLKDSGQFISEHNKTVKYRSCLLPFGTPERLTHVVAGLSWREF